MNFGPKSLYANPEAPEPLNPVVLAQVRFLLVVVRIIRTTLEAFE